MTANPILSDDPADLEALQQSVDDINCATGSGYRRDGCWFLTCACGLKTLGWESADKAFAALERMHRTKAAYKERTVARC